MPKKPPRNNPPIRERRTVQTAASVLQRITSRVGGPLAGLPSQKAAMALIDRLRPLLPEDVQPHLMEVLEKPGELVLFADSAVWAARLRLAASDLSAATAGRRLVVRVLPPGGMRR